MKESYCSTEPLITMDTMLAWQRTEEIEEPAEVFFLLWDSLTPIILAKGNAAMVTHLKVTLNLGELSLHMRYQQIIVHLSQKVCISFVMSVIV